MYGEGFGMRRRLVYDRISSVEGFRCMLPRSAFYSFPNIDVFGIYSEKFSESLMKQARVITVPGSAFGSCGEGYVQIPYAAAYEKLDEALNWIEAVVGSLR
jgi:aminotransferase